MERTLRPPGRFLTEWLEAPMRCRCCKKLGGVEFREWESDDRKYLDFQYRCDKCSFEWWIDGLDE
jgi:hypothetical protein